MTKPTEDQINAVLDQCMNAANTGISAYPGMSYEQGVEYAIDWLLEDGVQPFDDDN